MKLRNLLKDLPIDDVKGSLSLEVRGICSHSKKVKPGDLFIAKKGIQFDGTEFIQSALLAGAIAVVTDMYNPFYDSIVQIIAKDVASLEPILAARFYKNPIKSLFAVGITGTSGKTTTSFLTKHLLESHYGACGLIGTIGTFIQDHYIPSELTSPDAVTLQYLFHEMVTHQCRNVVMEVSSHALDQNRVDGVDFDICVYTNLSQDHLDYHPSMEAYAEVKSRLFAKQDLSSSKPYKKVALINRDDSYAPLMINSAKGTIITFGLSPEADIYAKDLSLGSEGSKFILCHDGKEALIETRLMGEFNVCNILAAAGVALARGMTISQIANSLKLFTTVPGRMERVENSLGLDIFVDYSHKPEALRNALQTCQKVKNGRLFVVFGCGGNRDKTKRQLMMQVAKNYADEVFVTSDNPRQEDPYEIINQIILGADRGHVTIEVDRKQAIYKALETAQKGDMILIAGKGHEKKQIFQNLTLEFDDVSIAKEAARSLAKHLVTK